MRTPFVILALGLVAGAILILPIAAAADECWGLNRWDCNYHPNCTTWNNHPGHCYFVYHTTCECRDLQTIVADVCAGAVELTDGTFDLEFSTADKANDYTLTTPGSCTGYTANGPDGVAYVYLAQGGAVEVHMQPLDSTTFDSSLYIVTDCADPMGTCVAGVDATVGGGEETLTYTSPTGGIYFIIFDAWTTSPPETNIRVWGEVAGSEPTVVEEASWGTIKAMYR